MSKRDHGVVLKPGKEKAIHNRHHWIFSGAISTISPFQDGDTLPVYSSAGEMLGYGYFNSKTNIRGRMLTFGAISPEEGLREHLDQAIYFRKSLFPISSRTTAYRLINAEGDFIPGLIVDQYDDILVMQITTKGMERRKEWLIDYFVSKVNPRAIYEISTGPSRKEEGLEPSKSCLYGSSDAEISILENGHRFWVSLETGQKTGFFLDHREMRASIQSYCNKKRVLNCFGYTGGFSVYAACAGAVKTVTVDVSEGALALARRNLDANKAGLDHHTTVCEDVFEYLRREELDYDLVILDPPAFAKKKGDVPSAFKGYKEINRQAMQRMPKNSFLLTCSCSYHMDLKMFQMVVFQAAVEAGREVQIIGRHRVAPDHPVNLFHPEGDYLKSLFLKII